MITVALPLFHLCKGMYFWATRNLYIQCYFISWSKGSNLYIHYWTKQCTSIFAFKRKKELLKGGGGRHDTNFKLHFQALSQFYIQLVGAALCGQVNWGVTYLAELSSQVAVQWMVWTWASFLCSWVGFLSVSFQSIDWKIHHPKSFFCQILIGNFLSSIHCVLYNNFQSVFNWKCPIKFVSFESWLMNLCLDRGKACGIENRPWLWLFEE